MAVSRKSTCTNDLQAELAVFSMEYHFNFKEQMTGRRWLFRLGCLADIFLKMHKESLSYQGEYQSVCVAKDKIWTSSKNGNFRKHVSATTSMTASCYLKTFLVRWEDILTNGTWPAYYIWFFTGASPSPPNTNSIPLIVFLHLLTCTSSLTSQCHHRCDGLVHPGRGWADPRTPARGWLLAGTMLVVPWSLCSGVQEGFGFSWWEAKASWVQGSWLPGGLTRPSVNHRKI